MRAGFANETQRVRFIPCVRATQRTRVRPHIGMGFCSCVGTGSRAGLILRGRASQWARWWGWWLQAGGQRSLGGKLRAWRALCVPSRFGKGAAGDATFDRLQDAGAALFVRCVPVKKGAQLIIGLVWFVQSYILTANYSVKQN